MSFVVSHTKALRQIAVTTTNQLTYQANINQLLIMRMNQSLCGTQRRISCSGIEPESATFPMLTDAVNLSCFIIKLIIKRI